MYNILTSHKSEEFDLEKFWKLESVGVNPKEETNETTVFLAQYQSSSIEFRDTQYFAKLPWKPEHDDLPSNFGITKRRTEGVIRRLKQDKKLLNVYGNIIEDQERRGFIEKVEDRKTTGPVHYIPHHPVKKDSSTTPIRIVYDCSCRQSAQHPSLNDCLMNAPPELNDLTNILLRFRSNPVVISTDIEKAFLHVGLHENDRDFTRFLWLSDSTNPDSELTTYRFKSVLCSPFILNATLLHHLQQHDSETAKLLERDLYVDNILSSLQDENQATTYFSKARDIMSTAGFNLRSWTSNSKSLRKLAEKQNVLDTDQETKVLGMRWNVESDELAYAKREILPTDIETVTKRQILRQSSRIYDPLGLLSPVTIRAKILIQELWRCGLDWDEKLPTEIRNTWSVLATEIERVTETKVTRCFFRGKKDPSKQHLHIFVDASTKAYGAVAYLYDETDTAFVMAKTRVALLKQLTLPQLELMAAVIGSRLSEFLRSTLDCENITPWSDSQIVLHWIKSTKTLKRFIVNRVKEIQELTNTCEWKYCSTNSNPADLITRGITAEQYKDNQLWLKGSKLITDDTENRLVSIQNELALSLMTGECDNSQSKMNFPKIEEIGIHNVMDVQRYGSFDKLLRVTSYVQRFIYNCKSQKNQRKIGPLTTEEWDVSVIMWIKSCQTAEFSEEILVLKSKSKITNKFPRIRQLRLYLDENDLLRCGGRMHNALIPETTKFPFLFPNHHSLTDLIVWKLTNRLFIPV